MLANLFLHYAFDAWMAREFPTVRFERYVDDAVVHCVSEQQAREVLAGDRQHGGNRSGCGCTPDKTRIVYCQDGQRRGSHGQAIYVPGIHVGSDGRKMPGQQFMRSCRRSARTP